MEELKPCPCCGEEAVFLCVMDSVAIVGCSNKISCWMKPSTSVYKNKEGDFNLFNWNNRPYENKIKADYEKEIERLKARLKASQEDNNKIRGRMHDQWIDQNKVKADAVRTHGKKALSQCERVDGTRVRYHEALGAILEEAKKLERGEL